MNHKSHPPVSQKSKVCLLCVHVMASGVSHAVTVRCCLTRDSTIKSNGTVPEWHVENHPHSMGDLAQYCGLLLWNNPINNSFIPVQ